MEFVQELQSWVRGEVYQGRVMICVGVLLIVATTLVIRSENALARGMLVPLILLVAMNCGYGYVLITRPQAGVQTEARYRLEPRHTLEFEYSKATTDEKYYASSRPAWAVLVAICAVAGLVPRNEYLKGLSLGLIGTFLGALVIDSFLHNRLRTFIAALQDLLARR